jgi:hypothetical protein
VNQVEVGDDDGGALQSLEAQGGVVNDLLVRCRIIRLDQPVRADSRQAESPRAHLAAHRNDRNIRMAEAGREQFADFIGNPIRNRSVAGTSNDADGCGCERLLNHRPR